MTFKSRCATECNHIHLFNINHAVFVQYFCRISLSDSLFLSTQIEKKVCLVIAPFVTQTLNYSCRNSCILDCFCCNIFQSLTPCFQHFWAYRLGFDLCTDLYIKLVSMHMNCRNELVSWFLSCKVSNGRDRSQKSLFWNGTNFLLKTPEKFMFYK